MSSRPAKVSLAFVCWYGTSLVIQLASIQCFILVATNTCKFYSKATYYALLFFWLKNMAYHYASHVDTPNRLNNNNNNTQRCESRCKQPKKISHSPTMVFLYKSLNCPLETRVASCSRIGLSLPKELKCLFFRNMHLKFTRVPMLQILKIMII